jgi:hypothetical protein
VTQGAVRLAANAIVLLHLAFLVFVVLGGFIALRWRWVAWAHIPAVLWGAAVEFGGWICPLTPLENFLRQRGGETAYEGTFITHYVLPVLYPAGLTRRWQVILGASALGANLILYGFILRARRLGRAAPG